MEVKSSQEYQVYHDDRFTKRILFQHGEHVIFVLNFQPGQELPTHNHPGTNVYLLVLNGGGTMTVDGNNFDVSEKEVIQVGGDAQFSFQNTSNSPTSLYVVLNKVPDERYAKDFG